MPHTDQILARADARPPPFACTATHGGLDAAWVSVSGELDIETARNSSGRCTSLISWRT